MNTHEKITILANTQFKEDFIKKMDELITSPLPPTKTPQSNIDHSDLEFWSDNPLTTNKEWATKNTHKK